MRAVVLAVEPSADLHGAELVRELKKKISCEFSGLGGRHLKAAGVDVWEDPTETSEMGVSSLSSLKMWYKRIKNTRKKLLKNPPDFLICIDSPDFNLRVAKGLRGKSRVIDYIAPQAWAWRPGRRKVVGRLFDQVLVIWPFEKEFFSGYGADVSWVGLPVLDHLESDVLGQDFPDIPHGCRPVALLPGSRPLEVKLNLPLFVEAAKELLKRFPDLVFVLPRAPSLNEDLFEVAKELKEFLFIQEGGALSVLKNSEVALVVNGTATIEAMLLKCPHVMTYAVTKLQKMLYSPFLKTPYFNMANILLNREVVPELVGERLTVQEIVNHATTLLDSESGSAQNQLASFDDVRSQLGGAGVAERASQVIVEGLHG